MSHTRERRTVLYTLVILIGVGIFAASCSLPADNHPRAIERDRLPALLSPNVSSTTTSVPADSPTAAVYFVKDGRLHKVDRKVRSRSASALLEQLAAGPTDGEKDEGISSAVPPNTKVLSAELSKKDVLTIDVTKDLVQLASPNNKTAYGQIVFTLIKSLDVRLVAVNVAGKPTPIATDNGFVDRASLSDFSNSNDPKKTSSTSSTGGATAAPTPTMPPVSDDN